MLFVYTCTCIYYIMMYIIDVLEAGSVLVFLVVPAASSASSKKSHEQF